MNISHFKLCIGLTCFAVATSVVADPITGSLSQDELVTLNATTSTDNGNQLVHNPDVSSGNYDRLKFGEKKEYRFERDKQIPRYLALKITSSSRLKVLPDQKIRFQIKQGSLMDNIPVLLSHTQDAKAYFPKGFTNSMRFYNDFYITGDNVADLINQMLEPWREQYRVHADAHINNIIEFTMAN